MLLKIFSAVLLFSPLLTYSSVLVLRDFKGKVNVSRATSIYKSMPLYSGDIIETEKGSRAKLFFGRDLKFLLGENSRVTVELAGGVKLLLKFSRGLMKVEEKNSSEIYEIKTTSAYVGGSNKSANYFISTSEGQTNLICTSGGLNFFEYNLKYDGTIPDGFLKPNHKGLFVKPFFGSSVKAGENGKIFPPEASQKMTADIIASYEKAVVVTPEKLPFNEENLFSYFWFDTPLPEIEGVNIYANRYKRREKVLPRVFRPEEKEGLSTITK